MAYLKWENSFSEKERDRRWQLIREFIQNKGMDALLVLGAGVAHQAIGLSQVETGRGVQMQTVDRYLSGWASRCTVVFPLKGEPVLLGVPQPVVLRWTPETPKEELPWIEDVRVSVQVENIVAVLKEKGLERRRVGVWISRSGAGGSRGSAAGYAARDQVAKGLPDCNFEDVGDDLHELMAVKGEEELVLFRRCSESLEQATIAIMKVVRPGATELDVHMAIIRTLYEHGAVPSEPYIASGPATTAPGGRLWGFGVGSPRVLEPGDVVNTGCTFAYIGGIEAQAQLTVAIPPVSSENAECARLARECYDEGLRTLRPGIPFKEVAEAMAAPLDSAGAWPMFPQIHSMNPNYFIGLGSEAAERRKAEYYKEYYERFHLATGGGHMKGEVVLKPGVVFQFEPDACLGRHRVNVGGNVIVTENGNEPLNEVGTRMRIAGEA